MEQAYIYMIRCEDRSIYTGIAADLKKRLSQHYHQEKECAKYTKSHKMQKLELVFTADDLRIAAKLEYRLKQLTRAQKELLITDPLQLHVLTKNILKDYAFHPFSREEIEEVNQAVCI